jgi:hypothetical protein
MKTAEPTKTTLACAGWNDNLGAFSAIQRGEALSKGRHGRIAPLYDSQLVLSWAYTVWLRGFGALQASLGQVWFLRTAAAGES